MDNDKNTGCFSFALVLGSKLSRCDGFPVGNITPRFGFTWQTIICKDIKCFQIAAGHQLLYADLENR